MKQKRKSIAASAAAGMLCALGIIGLCGLLFAALLHRQLLPMTSTGVLADVSATVGAFCGACAAIRLRGRQALPLACAVAGGLLLLACLGCAAGGASSHFGPWLPILAAAVLAGGIAGAVMSLRQNDRKKRRG